MSADKKAKFTESIEKLDKIFKDLESREFRIKNDAIKVLGNIKNTKAREKLHAIAQDSSWNVRLRVSAIDAIGRGGQDPHAQKLFATIVLETANDQEIRRAALTQLSRYRDPKNLPIFIAALSDPYRFIRFWGVRGLIKMRDPSAVKRIIQALGDEDEEIRKEVTAHLETLGDQVIKDLVQAFRDPNANKFLRYGVAGILGRSSHPEAIPSLIESLKDGNERLVTIAVRGLGKNISASSVDPLLELATKNIDKRPLVLDALFRIGQSDPRSLIEKVVPRLANNDQDLEQLITSLVEKLAPQSLIALDAVAHNDKTDPKIKTAITSIMEKIK
jgi:HEAT repeat protein